MVAIAYRKLSYLYALFPVIKITTETVYNHQIMIAIADNGAGISESILPKIFDQFFTTKPNL